MDYSVFSVDLCKIAIFQINWFRYRLQYNIKMSTNKSSVVIPTTSSNKNPVVEDFKVKFKTEICRNYQNGHCEYGSKCAFAHGEKELREAPTDFEAAKKQPCERLMKYGYCLYGEECPYDHSGVKLNQQKRRSCEKIVPILPNLCWQATLQNV